jgi:acetyl esterase/lipase
MTEDDRLAGRGGVPSRRRGGPASAAFVERRVLGERLGEQAGDASIRHERRTIGGVPCMVCTPDDPNGVVVELHGGGYRLGSASAWRPFGSRLAAACGAQVVLVDYGLAPEQPFPNALHDVLGVLGSVCASAGPQRVVVMGDSAGGGLALASVLAARKAGLTVAGTILLSPWLDLRNTADTFQSCAASDASFSLQAARDAAQTYLQGWSPDDPPASPLLGELDAAPPTLILVSGAEVLLRDSVELASRLATAGRSVDLHVFPDEPHVWPVLAPDTQSARRALGLVAAFVGWIRALSIPS